MQSVDYGHNYSTLLCKSSHGAHWTVLSANKQYIVMYITIIIHHSFTVYIYASHCFVDS